MNLFHLIYNFALICQNPQTVHNHKKVSNTNLKEHQDIKIT